MGGRVGVGKGEGVGEGTGRQAAWAWARASGERTGWQALLQAVVLFSVFFSLCAR